MTFKHVDLTGPEVGAMADHVTGSLDSREGAKVSEDGTQVWLYLLTDVPARPVPRIEVQ